MRTKDPSNDSGSYQNGVYTTKNGFSGTGLNCPKGTRLYNTEITSPIFFFPEDTAPGETFLPITDEVAPDVLPYYAVSNYGRVMNKNSGKIMKENYRPNGYGYFCLAADNCKNGQKKYSTHRLVMKAFDPVEDMDNLEVNHKDGDKTHNYINKIMPDGSVYSNLEWATKQENTKHRCEELNSIKGKLTYEDATIIRSLHDSGLTYQNIVDEYYPSVSTVAIQNICMNISYHDKNYHYDNESYKRSMYNKQDHHYFKVTDSDADRIRKLHDDGYNNKEIKSKFYPEVSESTISDIVRGISHNR